MAIEVRPATVFEDVAAMVGPKRSDATVCWCLSHRLPSKENAALHGRERGAKVASLLERGPIGVLAFARDQGATVIEGYPVDNRGAKVDTTMAYVGTLALFERAGFRKVADTTSVVGGFPRVLARHDRN